VTPSPPDPCVQASGNWMWAAKMGGEGAKMWRACEALRDALLVLGPGIDGGKVTD
jgi:phosphoribosylformylglycinamidine synthase